MGALASRGGGRWLLMLLVLVAAGFVGLALDGARSAADSSAGQDAPEVRRALDDALADAVPVASMATASSKTYRRPDGTFVTRVFAQKADAAARLKATADGFEASAGEVDASFPATLADPVRIGQGADWVSLQLRDGAGQGQADGSTITYADALPSASLEYTVSSGAVGEEIHLSGDRAPSSFVFDVRASAGVRAEKERNGTISLTNADGQRVFGLSPSYAYADRSRQDTEPVDTESHVIDGGWRITLSVDPSWLDHALAGGPVTIDPTVYLNGATQDCALSSDTPSVSFCADSQLWVGYNGDHDHHTLVKWNLSAIPKDAVALWGDASLFQDGSAPAGAKWLSVHRMTQAWTNGASWATYDGTHAWSTPGGDFDPTPAATAKVAAHQTGWTDWMVTSLVQHWIDGSLPNYGVAVQDKPSPQVVGEEDFFSTEGTGPSQAPELDIAWAPRTGSVDAYTLEGQSLDAKTTAAINVANGNLLLTTNDITSPGTGLDLRSDHYYNSLVDGDDSAALGVRTTASLGRDVRLRLYYGDIVSFERGDGVRMPFIDPVTSGSVTTWTAPYELGNVTLSRNNTTNTYTLELPTGLPSQPGKDLTLTFDNTGKLITLADQAGHTIGLSYYPGGDVDWPTLHGITDTTGASWTVDRGSLDEERIADILSPDNHHTTFSYLTTGRYLSQVTEADGSINRYGYDGQHRINSITTPDGNVTKITYSGTTTKVASLIRTTDTAHTTGPTTTITYNTPTTPCQSTNFDYTKNVVTRPDGTSTTYCANNHAQITYDTDNPTTATPSGEWYDLHDQYTRGTGTHSVTIAGADAGAGVKKLSLERGSGAEIAATTLACDPRDAQNPTACPHTASGTASFDPSAIAEGAQTFRAAATDYAANHVATASWVVNIDRTAPGLASGFTAYYDATNQQADIMWSPPDDPQLVDGTPGSGIGDFTYRYREGTGAWSAWTDNGGASSIVVPSNHAADEFDVEVQTADAVGNVGAIASAHVTTVALPDTSDCQAHDIGGYPASCVDQDQEDLPMDDEPDPTTVSLTAQNGTQAQSLTGPVHHTYRISVHQREGQPFVPADYRWGTIRNRPGKYVTGQAHNGWWLTSDLAEDAPPSTGGESSAYRRGYVTRGIGSDPHPPTNPPHGCGWVWLGNLDSSDVQNDVTADCSTSQMHLGDTADTHEKGFSKLNNCPPPSRIPASSNARCIHGTAIYITAQAGVDVCADVGLSPNGNTDGCTDPLLDEGGDPVHLPKNVCVEWRYVTGDDKWFMVKLRYRDNPTASWVFIPRTASSYRDSTLPNILTKGRAQCPYWLGSH
jgi:YD repeat-containing protein